VARARFVPKFGKSGQNNWDNQTDCYKLCCEFEEEEEEKNY
jgi:hypothetical protein